MKIKRKLEWILLAATAALLVLLKWLHIGVTHYNLFLAILMAWCLALILLFRWLAAPERKEQDG